MRKALFLSVLFFSLSTLAATTLEFVSGDYKVVATLDMNTGSATAKTQTHGTCMGTFVLDLQQNAILTINFDAMNGCENESAVVNINAMQFQSLMAGNTMMLTFTSKMFGETQRNAQVRVIETDIQ